MACCCCCCIPTIIVTGITVNTTTNVAVLIINNALPSGGKFKLVMPNSGIPITAQSVTPYTNPQATVQLSYTNSASETTLYASVYQIASHYGPVLLSSLVKKASTSPYIHGTVSSNNTVFITDKLPYPNVSYSTTTS